MSDIWLDSLITSDAQSGYKLAIKVSMVGQNSLSTKLNFIFQRIIL